MDLSCLNGSVTMADVVTAVNSKADKIFVANGIYPYDQTKEYTENTVAFLENVGPIEYVNPTPGTGINPATDDGTTWVNWSRIHTMADTVTAYGIPLRSGTLIVVGNKLYKANAVLPATGTILTTDVTEIETGGVVTDQDPDTVIAPYDILPVLNGDNVVLKTGSYENLDYVNIQTGDKAGSTLGILNDNRLLIYNGLSQIHEYDFNFNFIAAHESSTSSFRFGDAFAVGSKIVVGTDQGNSTAGEAFIYDLDWSNEIRLAPLTSPHDAFGTSVAIGSKIVIGTSEKMNVDGDDAGSMFIYDLDGTNPIYVRPSDIADGNMFGRKVAISDTKIIASARFVDGTAPNVGSIYIYNLDGTGEIKVMPTTQYELANFGASIDTNGEIIVVGAPSDYNGSVVRTGSMYIYNMDGTGEIKINPSDGEVDGWFGFSVKIYGGKIYVGAANSTVSGFLYAGKFYVYDLDGTNEQIFYPSNPQQDAYYGWDFAVTPEYIFTSAPYASTSTGEITRITYAASLFDMIPKKFSDLGDVDITTTPITTGQGVVWDGAKFVASDLVAEPVPHSGELYATGDYRTALFTSHDTLVHQNKMRATETDDGHIVLTSSDNLTLTFFDENYNFITSIAVGAGSYYDIVHIDNIVYFFYSLGSGVLSVVAYASDGTLVTASQSVYTSASHAFPLNYTGKTALLLGNGNVALFYYDKMAIVNPSTATVVLAETVFYSETTDVAAVDACAIADDEYAVVYVTNSAETTKVITLDSTGSVVLGPVVIADVYFETAGDGIMKFNNGNFVVWGYTYDPVSFSEDGSYAIIGKDLSIIKGFTSLYTGGLNTNTNMTLNGEVLVSGGEFNNNTVYLATITDNGVITKEHSVNLDLPSGINFYTSLIKRNAGYFVSACNTINESTTVRFNAIDIYGDTFKKLVNTGSQTATVEQADFRTIDNVLDYTTITGTEYDATTGYPSIYTYVTGNKELLTYTGTNITKVEYTGTDGVTVVLTIDITYDADGRFISETRS